MLSQNMRAPGEAMKAVLICHRQNELDCDGLSRWLGSFTDLCGIIQIDEPRRVLIKRAAREVKRVGFFRFWDVLAFKAYYRLLLARSDRKVEQALLTTLREQYPGVSDTEKLVVSNPNSPDVVDLLSRLRPDVVIARCKYILREEVFAVPKLGTFVLHPGICPEYRNAHGCFWALANRDLDNVGLTLLRIDRGVDTGPVYGYFSYAFDEVRESHHVIQSRVLFENLDEISAKLQAVESGTAGIIDTRNQNSAVWGQPWLSSYVRWKRAARSGT